MNTEDIEKLFKQHSKKDSYKVKKPYRKYK